MSPLHPGMFCAKFDWNCPSGSGEEDSKISSMYFFHFIIISPCKIEYPFIWRNLNSFPPRIICIQFGWNSPSGFGEENFLYYVHVFSLFRYYIPWKREWSFIWAYLNSLHQMMLCLKLNWNLPIGLVEDF